MKQSSAAADFIRNSFSEKIDLAIVQGSGINIADSEFEELFSVKFTDIPGFPHPTVEGHGGVFSIQRYKGKNIAFFKGRIHYYEGYSMWEVAFPVRLMHHLKISKVIFTNAAGSVNRGILPGDLVLLKDYINLVQDNPLIGHPPDTGPRFIDMSAPFNADMREKAKNILRDLDIDLKEGTYCFLTGPTYETTSEVRMVSLLGADLVGMSTVPEIIMARQLDMDILGLSLCTNLGTGLSQTELSHEEVIQIGKKAENKFRGFIKGFIDVL